MEDTPGTENLHKSFCFETELLNCMVGDDIILTDSILDAYSLGSSKYLKTHAFSLSMDPEGGKIPAAPLFIPSNSEQKNCPLLKVSFFTNSVHIAAVRIGHIFSFRTDSQTFPSLYFMHE